MRAGFILVVQSQNLCFERSVRFSSEFVERGNGDKLIVYRAIESIEFERFARFGKAVFVLLYCYRSVQCGSRISSLTVTEAFPYSAVAMM